MNTDTVTLQFTAAEIITLSFALETSEKASNGKRNAAKVEALLAKLANALERLPH